MSTHPNPKACSILASLIVVGFARTIVDAQDTQLTAATWTICTDQLELIETTIVSADEQLIVIVDPLGMRQNLAINTLIFAIPTRPQTIIDQHTLDTVEPQASVSPRFITLTDGQVISAIITPSSFSDTLSCVIIADSIERGAANINLERVRTISEEPVPSAPNSQIDTDSITTRNNDVIKGFIESVSTSITISTDRESLDLKLEQIRSIELANFPAPVAGFYIQTRGGLNLRVSSFDFDFEHPLSMKIDTQSLGLDAKARDLWLLKPDAPAGIWVSDPSRVVRSLAAIEPELVEPTGSRDWTPTPTVLESESNPILSTIDLHAPVRVLYPLPVGATRFACELVAPINTYTDCIATIYSISYAGERSELLTERLNKDHDSQQLNIELPPRTEKIEIRIDPGVNGPIQDRVLIVHPRLLIEHTPSP